MRQVFVSANADLGLEFVRLEAQSGSDPLWYCLESWTPTIYGKEKSPKGNMRYSTPRMKGMVNLIRRFE